MKSHRQRSSFLLLLALAGCSADHQAPPDGRLGGRALEAEPVAVLGGSGILLAKPTWITEDRLGRYVVTDDSDRNVKLFTASGEHVSTIGRAGQGPGEFQGLQAALVRGDSIVTWDFVQRRFTVFDSDGRLGRAFTPSGSMPTPWSVRVMDDSLFLFASHVNGNTTRALLALVEPDGDVVETFLDRASYFGDDPKVLQNTGLVADAYGGLVFAAFTGADSIHVFDSRGRTVGAGPADPVEPLVSVHQLLEESGGKDWLPDGRHFTDGNRNVVRLVALDSATVAVQITRYDAALGTDPLEGGTIVLHSLGSDGVLRMIGRADIPAGLVGRDRHGRALLMAYRGEDAFTLLRLRAAPPREGA